MKKLYLTTRQGMSSWHYIGDPVNPNTTFDVGTVEVADPSEIRIDHFGAYVEREFSDSQDSLHSEKDVNKLNFIEQKIKEFEERYASAGVIGDRQFKEYLPHTFLDIEEFIRQALKEQLKQYEKHPEN